MTSLLAAVVGTALVVNAAALSPDTWQRPVEVVLTLAAVVALYVCGFIDGRSR